MNTRMRKIFGDIASRRGRTLMVSLSIMIGVFGVTALVGMGDLLVSQLEADLNEDEIAHTHVYVVSPGGSYSEADNQGYLDALAELPGVTDVEGQAIYPIDWRLADGDKYEPGTVIAFTEAFEDVQLEPISRVVEGRYPVEGQNELAIEQRFAEENGVEVGDTLVFRSNTEAANEPWTVVGVVFQPYLTISPHSTDVTNPATRPQTNMYTTYNDAQQIVGFPGLSSFYARYTDTDIAEASVNDLIEAVSAQTPYTVVMSYIEDPASNSLVEGMQQFASVLNALAFIAMIVSVFLVVNVINTIVVEQKQQIGVLKSLGASRMDNFLIYAGMAFFYGVIGTIFGVIIATPVGSLMAQELAPLAGTYIGEFRISIMGIVTGIALGLLIPVLASLLPVFNGTRVSILDAMTDLGISSNWGSSRLSRLVGRLPVPMNIRQALSNIIQKRWRLALTGFTLTLAVGAFMGVTAVFASLDETIEGIFDTFDYEILMQLQSQEDVEQITQLLNDNYDDINAAYVGYSLSVDLQGYIAPENTSYAAGTSQMQVLGIQTETGVIRFEYSDGEGWSNDPTRQGVVLNESVVEQLGKKAGDMVLITVNGQTYEYEIIGVMTYPFDTMFMNWQELATIADFVDADGNAIPSSVFIDLAGEPDASATADRIEEIKVLMSANGIQAVYANQPENQDTIGDLINSFGMLFNMTSGVMAAVGAIGLLATLSMAVFERQKEIGVMRSLGAGSSTIIVQFLVEGVLVGIIAWVFGAPLSVMIGNGLSQALDLGDVFAFEYPPMVLVQGLIGVIIIAAFASIYPSISAARKTVSDILRYQ